MVKTEHIKRGDEVKLAGISASGGLAIGNAHILKERENQIDKDLIGTVTEEVDKFYQALEASQLEVKELIDETKKKLGDEHAQIFEAHLALLEDPSMTSEVETLIKDSQVSAVFALDQVSQQHISMFEALDDPYMRERANDLKDVMDRVSQHLQGVRRDAFLFQKDSVIFAKDLTPSDTVGLDTEKVKGLVTEAGGKTSHTAIMARSLGIPAVVGVGVLGDVVENGDLVILDGDDGVVYVNPDEELVGEYEGKIAKADEEKERLEKLKELPAVRANGEVKKLMANIGSPSDVEAVLENGADGIGLFRSEFLFMNRNEAPTEDEQFEAYRVVLEKMEEKPVIVRTMDIGGDKEIPYLNLPKEENPFLGYRAIRISLHDKGLFKVQLRALLRASVFGQLKIMFPMISTVAELQEAKDIVQEVKDELKEEQVDFRDDVEIGIMIETPAAAMISAELAKEVDFFSIGTNDLIQYTMAADRMNDSVSYLYDPKHPGVQRLIEWVIKNAHHENIEVGMCGETAGDPELIPLYLDMGLDEFSMTPASIPKAKQLIRSL
ncbi:phosphoenolpyruvate--protein phosphotransferase [Alkalibacillus aidingensis]|uniref:phosphoenolpyruvate--protein phosphotransferase n=1 Tax=Alkalibacillus aidingensis TaxID=2747607 RepID=UPI001660B0E1|nr:phosphoenolpyruvate--protein phosphotransferase [Alkalibacillus aidingensis]